MGPIGRLFDRVIFRPLIGWATAWSFDRLRLWIEKDIDPAASMRQSMIHLAARLTLALVYFYHGLVPKLIFHHPDELAMLRTAGLSDSAARTWCNIFGWLEILFSLIVILAWRARWPLWLTIIAMPAAVLGVALKLPGLLTAPFNPATLNLSVFALAAIALLAAHDLPSSSRCIRRPPKVKT